MILYNPLKFTVKTSNFIFKKHIKVKLKSISLCFCCSDTVWFRSNVDILENLFICRELDEKMDVTFTHVRQIWSYTAAGELKDKHSWTNTERLYRDRRSVRPTGHIGLLKFSQKKTDYQVGFHLEEIFFGVWCINTFRGNKNKGKVLQQSRTST